jgi:hypothetical protein
MRQYSWDGGYFGSKDYWYVITRNDFVTPEQ